MWKMTLEITLDTEAHWCTMWLTSAHLLFMCYNPDTNYQGNRPQQLSTATYKSHEKLHLQSLLWLLLVERTAQLIWNIWALI